MLLILIVVWSCNLHGIISTEISDGSSLDVREVKRLLLNDPDVVGARLAELDRAIQEMKKQMAQVQSQVSDEKTRNNNLMSTVTQLDRASQEMKKKMDQVQSQLSEEKTRNDNLVSTVTKLQSSFGREKAKTVNLEAVTSQMSASIQRGFTAGQNYYDGDYNTRFGGASNLLCLPNNPEMSNRSAPGGSYLYGTEYEQTFFGSRAVDEDVPCALCRSKYTYSSVMIPGRKTCYLGWKIEYYGYLASDSYSDKASSFICVDASPEFIQGGKANRNGNLLYGTGTICGSLPCPPYDDNFAVLCVVCSK
ncbi:Hypothetical predicted protein [Mytilus galloprovincialis]|uniref:Uncharacterized protein n=1 Tax=Mytilus galloprovincialis TaxID=29158 RepID=A0A8B6G1M4_MYTGA|nr:Hypothetical predicted protein [Mytilus galloprovincialis]